MYSTKEHSESVVVEGASRVGTCILIVMLVCGCESTANHESSTEKRPSTTHETESHDSEYSFTNIAEQQDLHVVSKTGSDKGRYSIVESLGSGIAVLDYDQDGDADVFALRGGTFTHEGKPVGLPAVLLENTNGTFQDVTEEAAIRGPDFYPHGICVFDHEGDGFPDILVTGFFGCWLYSNQKNKQFRRIDPETLGIDQETFYSSAASGDFNADGIADLFLATYVDWSAENNPPCTVQGQLDICPPGQFEGLPDQVYLGTKSGRFRSANNNFQPSLTGKGLGVIAADFDLDGDTDVYVANDTTPNALYENNENEGFTEVGLLSGVSIGLSGLADGSMGVDSADVDMDGLPDLWVANYEDESFALYRNMRKLIFQNVSLPMKIGLLRRRYVGFGTAFLDINFDGYEDIFCTNGHVLLAPKGAPRRQKALLLHNEKGKYFVDVASSSGRYFSESHTGRGAAVADLDGDGDQDIVVSHADEPIAILLNDARPEAVIRVKLVGSQSHRDAVGAFATLETSRRKLLRLVKGGGSYLSANEKTLTFCLGEDEHPKSLSVAWPSGHKNVYTVPAVKNFFEAREGHKNLIRLQ